MLCHEVSCLCPAGVKSLNNVSGIPVVAITASVSPEDMQKALDSGCSGFIRKPIDIDEFPAQVNKYIP